ncbi:MAG: YkgJ family cysteine cluster protein [Phycisphaerae bacterium]|nr:YkgJ family cysteine cluster protein [Phycisphaerae bacterium]MDD5381607.1 YkgJ family cysteine cluster protein [Phycisphaerae bacterium]
MELESLKKLHTILEPYDNICPCNCYLCEERETAMLLPNEEKLILRESNSTDQFKKHNDGFFYLDMGMSCPFFEKKNDKGECAIYLTRPVDCRIFPFYPYFNLKTNSYVLMQSETYCPIAKDTSIEMERDVKIVLDIVNKFVSKAWKETYNKLNYQRLHNNFCTPYHVGLCAK